MLLFRKNPTLPSLARILNQMNLATCAFLLTLGSCDQSARQNLYTSYWEKQPNRHWIGPEYWANRIQDWQIKEGQLECLSDLPNRTVHLLTHYLSKKDRDFSMEMHIGGLNNLSGADTWAGFLIGAGDLDLDYRARAQIHNATGNNGGLIGGIDGQGRLTWLDNEDSLRVLGRSGALNLKRDKSLTIKISGKFTADRYLLTLSAQQNGDQVGNTTLDLTNGLRLSGNVALIVQKTKGSNQPISFQKWTLKGEKFELAPEQSYGPVLGVLYSLSRGTLKLTAQLPVVGSDDQSNAILEVLQRPDQNWVPVDEKAIEIPGWTVLFRVENWNENTDHQYRIRYDLVDNVGGVQPHYYYGKIPATPDTEEMTIAAFTGNYNGQGIRDWRPEPHYYDFSHNRMWFPHQTLDKYVSWHKPDLLVYTGDQVYESSFTYRDDSGEYSSYLDYFNKWNLFLWAHGNLTRNIPTVCITDDHDVFMINYWGESGKKARELPQGSPDQITAQLPEVYKNRKHFYRHDGGGYIMPAEWVNMVQRTQTSHLPDPVDPTPVEQGIEVYFTEMLYGNVSFAILEDRKFKSAPRALLPEGNIRNGFPLTEGYDLKKADHPQAVLLGKRQLRFLENWSTDWTGADMKIVLSATVLASVNSEPQNTAGVQLAKLEILPYKIEPENYGPSRDMDTNGWPQSGRNNALRAIRKGFGFMIAGDQHLATIVHHGIDDWNDAGFSFCVPSIANIAPRRWFTQNPGLNRIDGSPRYTGNHYDAFGNRMYVWAAANPYLTGKEPGGLFDRATGYGIIKINKRTQEIKMECWPRWADPSDPDSKQYNGWPKTITIADNYGKVAVEYLPEISYSGLSKPPVVQVIDDSNQEIIYTIRIKEKGYRPKVFKTGYYTIRIGEPGTNQMKTLSNLKSSTQPTDPLTVIF